MKVEASFGFHILYFLYIFFYFCRQPCVSFKKKFSSENLFNSSEQVLKSFLVNNL